MFQHKARIRTLASPAAAALLAVVLTACSAANAATERTASESASQARNAAGAPFGGTNAQDLSEKGSQERNSATVSAPWTIIGTHPGGHGPQK